METAQIMMMPMASATPASSSVSCGCAGAEAGFGSLLGQTLELLQQSGIMLTSTSVASGAGEATSLSEPGQDPPDAAMLLAQLVDGISVKTAEEPVQDTDGEQERAQQLAGFLQAAMLVPVTVQPAQVAVAAPAVSATSAIEPGQAVAEVAGVAIEPEQAVADVAGVAIDPPKAGQEDAVATDQQQKMGVEVELQPTVRAILAQETSQRSNEVQYMSPNSKQNAADIGMRKPGQAQQFEPMGQQVAAAVRAAEPSSQSESVKAAQTGMVMAAVEGRNVVVEVPAAPKGAAPNVAPVRFAQPSDVVVATALPDQQRQQEQSLLGQHQGKPIDADMQNAATVEQSQDAALFELQMTSATQPETPAGHALGVTIQHLPGAQLEVQAAEPAKVAAESQVMRQVADRLEAHEIKKGSDQISLKLSPEHLGNLQLNLRMEDQQVRVEIVAEHRAVREALLQQVDQLKESLSRQNIKMESFDVTTANNGGLNQQQNGDWRQTASERRPLLAQQYGASRNVVTGTGGMEASVHYFAPQYNSTLDVRF